MTSIQKGSVSVIPFGEAMVDILSLFSGCGGFDTGFVRRGFKHLGAYDVDDQAIETYNRNFATKASKIDLSNDEPPNHLKPDVILAGPPCQGFSTIGKMDRDDHRNSLLLRTCQIATTYSPRIIIIENVPGVVSNRFGTVFDAALSILSANGYFVDWKILTAENLGVAQRRRRLFIVARKGAEFSFELGRKKRVTIRDALSKVTARPLRQFPTDSTYRKISEKIRPGQKLCNVRQGENCVHTWEIPSAFGKVTKAEADLLSHLLKLRRTNRQRDFGDADPVDYSRIRKAVGESCMHTLRSLVRKGYVRTIERHYDLKHTFNGMFRRLELDGVSPTVDTHFGNPRLFLHPTKHRGLSYLEAAALQGFPMDYCWPSLASTRFRLIGNAVPPPISRELALFVRGLLG